jgi:hypothetical protein
VSSRLLPLVVRSAQRGLHARDPHAFQPGDAPGIHTPPDYPTGNIGIRSIMIGMIPEYARRNGRVDVMRELIDGVTRE